MAIVEDSTKQSTVSRASDPRLKDKSWRMSNLYKIVDKFTELVTFKPNTAQAHFLKYRHKNSIILKSRRIGFTTLSGLDSLDNTLFTRNYNSLFVSYDEPSAKKVFDELIMLAWRHLKDIQRLWNIDISNANTLKMEFGDDTFSTIEVKASGRGGRYNQIHISEFGKICAKYPAKADEILSGTVNALTPSGWLTIESTAEGDTGSFHDMFWKAYEKSKDPNYKFKDFEYKAFFYNWQWDRDEIDKIKEVITDMPKNFLDYQAKHNEKAKLKPSLYKPITDLELSYWYAKYVKSGSKWNKLLQEYPTTVEEAFIHSGSKLFDAMKLEDQRLYETTPNVVGDWNFYEDPKVNHTYIVAADPSEGVGKDHSAIVILDLTPKTPKVVATYKNNFIPPDMLAYEIKNQARAYGYAVVMVERNNTGHSTLSKLKEIYPPELIYKEEKYDKEDTTVTERLGWHTNLSTKPRMFFDLSTAVNEGLIEIPSAPIIYEMRMYNRDSLLAVKADPDASNHFDLLTALAIAYQGRAYVEVTSTTIETINLKTDPTINKHYNDSHPNEKQSFDPFAGI